MYGGGVTSSAYSSKTLAPTRVPSAGSVCGQAELDELLSKRDKLNSQVQSILDEATDPWGIKVMTVEINYSDTAGDAYIGDQRLGELSEKELTLLRREKVGFIFQAFNLIADMTVFENIELPLIMTQVRLNLVLMVIHTLKGWGLVFILLGDSGGPRGVGMLPGLYMFHKAFTVAEVGYACAIGLLLFFLILITYIPQISLFLPEYLDKLQGYK